jgi:hypothetical protein
MLSSCGSLKLASMPHASIIDLGDPVCVIEVGTGPASVPGSDASS